MRHAIGIAGPWATVLSLMIMMICAVSDMNGADATDGWTVMPKMIEDDLVNPGRGFFRWNGQEECPAPCPDRYARYNWSMVEKQKGVYDFAILDKEAAAARNAGGTFGFGVRCVVGGVAMACPAYLKDEVAGWMSVKKTAWVPDWNSDAFLTRIEALTAALGARFNRDPRIGYIEIRTYGNWGEWHLSGFEDPPVPMLPITERSVHRIIDAWVSAFPDKQLIMMSDHGGGLSYALALPGLRHPVGWRRDSWGNKQFFSLMRDRGLWEVAQERWKVAPVTVESYGGTGHDTVKALAQTTDFHVSAIGNGNFGRSWKQFPPDEQKMLMRCAMNAGYRYGLQDLQIATSGYLLVTAHWINAGVAPIYTDWDVTYRLRQPKTGSIAWQGNSQLCLRGLLPSVDPGTKALRPREVVDRFARPANLAAGTYTVEVVVTDHTGYFSDPLRLAIQGRQQDGSYALGDVTLR